MNAFIFSGQIDSYRSLQDKTLKISIVTAKEVTPELAANISQAQQDMCFIAISPDLFTTEQIEELDNAKADYDDGGKTPSERMRAVLYVMWKQNNERYDVFNDFYRAKMERLIDHFKSKLL